jgi:glycosyltransferase involved in cell wall biosynthesis
MNSPTVLHVIPGLGGGGAEHMLSRLVTAKRAETFTPVVADLLGGGELAAAIRATGVPVHELGLRNWATLPGALFGLAALIRRLRPAAIQSWLYYADLLALWSLELSGLRQSTRLYWGVRCSDMDLRLYGRTLRWAVAACARRAGRADAVVANSYAGRAFHERLGYKPRAFPVIPNGIDLDGFRPDAAARRTLRAQFGIADDKPMALHVARVNPMKDHATLLALAASLSDVRFVIAGHGTEELGAPGNVLALGNRADVATLYTAADVFVLTSAFGEGFPNVVAEAMACGTPVVSTEVGDARLIVGETGVVVPPRDVAALAAALRRLLAEPEAERRRRAQMCRERIERYFSLDRAVAAFDALHLHGRLPEEPVEPAARAQAG